MPDKKHSPLWLLRKERFAPGTRKHLYKVFGPYSGADLERKIRTHEIVSEDQICPENSYWFSVGEIEELKKHFSLPVDLLNDLARGSIGLEPDANFEPTLPDIGSDKTPDITTTVVRKKPEKEKISTPLPKQAVSKVRENILSIGIFLGIVTVALIVRWVVLSFQA